MRDFKVRQTLANVAVIVFLVTSCATHTHSLKFTQSEVKRIPAVALQKVLSPTSTNETVRVWARGVSGPAEVKSFEGQQSVTVKGEGNENDKKLPFNAITELEHIWRSAKPKTFVGEQEPNSATAVTESLIYAPCIPAAIATWPFLRASGLDALKNDEDKSKARLVYEGMSKKDLITQ